MAHVQSIAAVSDRVMATLIAGLELEFGRGAAEGLARQFIEAEDVDFTWESRVEERWLGGYEVSVEDDIELDRVAMLGRLDGAWIVAVCVVDGDGMAHGLIGKRAFSRIELARDAFGQMD